MEKRDLWDLSDKAEHSPAEDILHPLVIRSQTSTEVLDMIRENADKVLEDEWLLVKKNPALAKAIGETEEGSILPDILDNFGIEGNQGPAVNYFLFRTGALYAHLLIRRELGEFPLIRQSLIDAYRADIEEAGANAIIYEDEGEDKEYSYVCGEIFGNIPGRSYAYLGGDVVFKLAEKALESEKLGKKFGI